MDAARRLAYLAFAMSMSASAAPTAGDVLGPIAPTAWCRARYSRSIAGSSIDAAYGAAVDASGSLYVTGATRSANFPVTAGAFDTTYNGLDDTFVVKLSPQGSIAYATFLGGSSHDLGWSIVVSGSDAILAGNTDGGGYPTTPGAFDPTFNGVEDIFVTRLDAAGGALVYSTFLGGSSNDTGWGLAVDGAGRAFVSGASRSGAYPTTPGAFSRTNAGGDDAVVSVLSPAGDALVYSTYVGGAQDDLSWCIAVDAAGSAYIGGQTHSVDFPVTPGAFQTTFGGFPTDAFVVKLAPSGATLAYGTFLGDNFGEGVLSMAVDAAGSAYALGRTDSPGFPSTPGAFDPTYNGYRDIFVTKLDGAGAALVYSTFLGGSDADESWRMGLDASGRVHVAGGSASADFPVTPLACQTTIGGGYDAVLVILGAGGDALVESTFIGTARYESAHALALRGGERYVGTSREVTSPDFVMFALP